MSQPGWTLAQALDRRLKALAVTPVEGVPGLAGTNPSGSITWTGEVPTQVSKVVDGATYTKTLTWSGGMLLTWSAWA